MRADLHIHSCLSPCASLDMSPGRIVDQALNVGLDIIAITDHNSAGNLPALESVARNTPLKYIFGIEICTMEEIHILSYFEDLESVMTMDQWLMEFLPKIKNEPLKTGDQPIVDGNENIIELFPWYLNNAITQPLETILNKIHAFKGIAVPAHIDRPSFSVLSQLGFLPSLPFDALEISHLYHTQNPELSLFQHFPLLFNSDSHSLDEIGRTFTELPDAPTAYQSLKKHLSSFTV